MKRPHKSYWESNGMKNKKHQYTVELLFHFNCGTCENWWSYATTPYCLTGSIEYNSLPEHIDYYCPHCGAAEQIEVKEGFEKT